MGSSPSQAAEAGPGSRARGAGWDAAQPDSGQGVLTIGGGGGGLILGSHVGKEGTEGQPQSPRIPQQCSCEQTLGPHSPASCVWPQPVTQMALPVGKV